MPKLLLHACCAPCLSGVLFQIVDYTVSAFYCNPNITENEEYSLRLEELSRFCASESLECIEGVRDSAGWLDLVGAYADKGERSHRCYLCYQYRLEESFKFAVSRSFDCVGSVLSVSPHKNYRWIQQIGTALSEKYDIPFYDADFKKNNGFLVSVQNSKKYDFYRQSYCGCEWSRLERMNKSPDRNIG